MKSLLQQPDDQVKKRKIMEEEDWPGYTGGIFLGRRVVAMGGLSLGDLMEKANRAGNPSVPAMQGIIDYGR